MDMAALHVDGIPITIPSFIPVLYYIGKPSFTELPEFVGSRQRFVGVDDPIGQTQNREPTQRTSGLAGRETPRQTSITTKYPHQNAQFQASRRISGSAHMNRLKLQIGAERPPLVSLHSMLPSPG